MFNMLIKLFQFSLFLICRITNLCVNRNLFVLSTDYKLISYYCYGRNLEVGRGAKSTWSVWSLSIKKKVFQEGYNKGGLIQISSPKNFKFNYKLCLWLSYFQTFFSKWLIEIILNLAVIYHSCAYVSPLATALQLQVKSKIDFLLN